MNNVKLSSVSNRYYILIVTIVHSDEMITIVTIENDLK